MDITKPGVQNPHWEPWARAIRSYEWEGPVGHMTVTHVTCLSCESHMSLTWQGWRAVLALPRPSTVVMASPAMAQSGARQAFTA